MQPFHIIIRPRGPLARPAGTAVWAERQIAALRSPPEANACSFAVSYEEVAEPLTAIPRLYLEPDGSFCWVSPDDVTQRLDGQITDDGRRVMCVQVQGRCTWSGFEPILRVLGWPGQAVMYQLLPSATLVDDASFRQAAFE